MEISRDLVAGLTIALGGLAPAMAIGKMAAAAMESLGRNPESAPGISSTLILALAFCEAIAIYALVVALAVKFVG
ncbi:MAG: ATP synthase F0 subunit C [Chloroflexi bacterium]|nr:ATP synthase F0 subunit C [Chloroflexota bacterium]